MSDATDQLRNDVALESAGSTAFEVEAFAGVVARRLEDAEQVFDVNVEFLNCRGPRSKRLELAGYAEDPNDASLILLVSRYFGSDVTLTLSEAREVIGRATGFIESSASGWLAENLEASSRECVYAAYFQKKLSNHEYSRIRILLITDGVMSQRIRTIESNVVVGLKTSYEVWDGNRIVDAALPELGTEDIRVDFTKWLPGGLPCLVAQTADKSTDTYLAVIPGDILAEVFEEFGSVLLESNVRTFLSARGAVNRGIQATLSREPHHFLAYNNGLTTTATAVELVEMRSGMAIKAVDRWQIVNGGQTTASIAHFLRSEKGRNVDGVSVQMKLVRVVSGDAVAMVHAIAKYANSQNKISGADLFSTHEFHVRLEQISRRLRAPAREGNQYQTGWYYERARGQWENDRAARGGPAERKKFEMEYPQVQRITKTDWARNEYCWGMRPHLVSKGAQSVFAEYAVAVDAQWERKDADFGDGYFKAGVAKAILYQELRAGVLRSDWYKQSPGYLANIVAYAIAKFSAQLQAQFPGSTYDLASVWQRQRLSESSLAELLKIAHLAQRHLNDPSRPQGNVTQWAKQQACWERLLKAAFALDDATRDDLEAKELDGARRAEDREQRKMDSGFEGIARVIAVTVEVWRKVVAGSAVTAISPMESDLIRLFGVQRGNVPTERQAAALLRLLSRMESYGVIGADEY